ncbi:hypothetical protein [Marinoscillum sp.]|uniref:hypothetical protein n=1 Tax=Marinoscillum sp. TaxID=2024838 RepID=UPI003BA8BCBE
MGKSIVLMFTIILVTPGCHIRNKENRESRYTTIVKLAIKDQKVSSEWIEALRTRESGAYLDSLADSTRPISEEELAWYKLIASIAGDLNLIRDSLNVPFNDIAIADTIYILLGYHGSDDGFTYQNQTICFDLTALYDNYGSAHDITNGDRMMRLMSHEFTHLLAKKWMKKNKYEVPKNHFAADTAFRKHILWEMWYEGFGVYRSMSSKWFPKGDSLSPATQKVLGELSPVFVEKVLLMDTTKVLTTDQKRWIQENVSDGPFRQKYAALPIGIWLALEARGNDENLSEWVNRGPDGILGLAKKHLTGEHKKKFDEVFHDRYNF